MTLADIAEYYVVTSPEMIAIVLPVALLLSLLYALTQHARHNEITAMRAAGIGLWRLALPYLLVGFLASVALFAINELWAPDADVHGEFIKARRVQKAGVKSDPRIVQGFGFYNSRDARNWQTMTLNIETMTMTQPIVRSIERDAHNFPCTRATPSAAMACGHFSTSENFVANPNLNPRLCRRSRPTSCRARISTKRQTKSAAKSGSKRGWTPQIGTNVKTSRYPKSKITSPSIPTPMRRNAPGSTR